MRKTLISSTIAYVMAMCVVILLHETSHAVAGILQGSTAIQAPFAVDYDPPLATNASVVASMTGPLFSLVTGLLAMLVNPFGNRPFWRMAWGWYAFLSAEEGFGYFTIAGIIKAGDTGTALGLLNAPGWTYWACFVFGVGGLFFLAWRFARVGVSVSTDLNHMRNFCVWAWIAGTVVSTLLTVLHVVITPGVLPASIVAVVIGAASLGVFAPMSMMFKRRLGYAMEQPTLPNLPVAGLVVIIVIEVVNLLLTRTPHWG